MNDSFKPLDSSRSKLNRGLVGLIAVGCLAAGGLIALSDSIENVWCAGLVRVGLLMGGLWIALSGKGRAATWTNVSPYWIFGLGMALFVILRRPQVLLPLALAVVVLALLGARAKR